MSHLISKPNVTVVSGLGLRIPKNGLLVQEELLVNFVKLLKPSSNMIYVITGDFAYNLDQDIHVVRIMSNSGELFLFSVIRFVLAQIKISYELYKLRKIINIVLFISGTRIFVMPVLFSKFFGIKVVSGAGGRVATMGETLASEVGSTVFYISKLLERINFYLADTLFIESPSAITFLELETYREKIIVSGGRYIDTNIFKMDKTLHNRNNLIGYIGRVSKTKGVDNFVRAMPLILNTFHDMQFVIGGDGPLFKNLKDQLHGTDLYRRVDLRGWISHDDVPKFLSDLKLFVFPSVSEGLPGVVQEAMACGIPVLATPVGGVPDLIIDGKTGFIMENNSPECIAKNVIRALEHPRLDEITSNARKLIENEYSYDVMVKKLETALHGL